MSAFNYLLLAAGLWALAANPSRAAGPADELRRFQDEAEANHPELAAASANERGAQAMAAGAGALPGPEFGVNWSNDGWSPSLGTRDMSVLNFTWEQPLPAPGKRRLEREVAHHGAHHAAANRRRLALTFRAGVARLYWRLLAARAQVALYERSRATLALAADAARARYAAGRGNQSEVLRAEAESEALEGRLQLARAEADGLPYRLGALLGRPAGEAVSPAESLPETLPEFDAANYLATLDARHPDIDAARAVVESGEQSAALARAARRPDFALMGGYGHRGALDPMWMAGVRIMLPSRRAARAESARAEAGLQSGRAHQLALRNDLEAAARQRIARLNAQRAAERVSAERELPRRRLAWDAALADYRAGRATLGEALENRAELEMAEMTWIDRRLEALMTLADLEAADASGDDPMLDSEHHPDPMP